MPGETPETLEEIRAELVSIYSTIRPSAWDDVKIKEMMNKSFALQRRDINKQAENLVKLAREAAKKKRAKKNNSNNINQPDTSEPVVTTIMLQERWPFLFKPDGMMSHFRELTTVDFDDQLKTFLSDEVEKIMEFFAKKKGRNGKNY